MPMTCGFDRLHSKGVDRTDRPVRCAGVYQGSATWSVLPASLLGVLAALTIACSGSDGGVAMARVCDDLVTGMRELRSQDCEAAGDSFRSAASEAGELQDEDLEGSVAQVVNRYTAIIRDGITGPVPEPERRELVSATRTVESACGEAGYDVDLSGPFISD